MEAHMKKQRRFTKRFEIEAEINKLKLKANRKLIEADDFHKVDTLCIINSNAAGMTPGDRQFLIEQATAARLQCKRLLRTAEIINEEKIPSLVRTLAAFQTITLFKDDDRAVVLQK
jgi:hypothetical protein